MELDHLQAFLAIVQRGGVTRAAGHLHLSQPAISRRLHLLEQELGAALFDRIGRTLVLSEAGRAFVPHAQLVLTALRDGLEAVRALQDPSRGTVTLALVGTLASSSLTRTLRRFREQYPAIDLRLRTALSAEVSELVRCGDAALGLRYRADSGRDLICTKVFDERMQVVCSSQFHLAGSDRVSAKQLVNERWVAFPARPGRTQEPYASALEQRLADNGLNGAEIIPIDSLSAQKRLVEAGFGLALLPESSIVEELRARTLCVLRAPSMRASIPVMLVRRRLAQSSAAAHTLERLLHTSAQLSPTRRTRD